MSETGTSATWDGPVQMVFTAKISKLKKAIRSFIPVPKKGLGLRGSIRAALSEFGQGDTIEVWSSKPYSEIQDQGGFIPPFEIPSGQRRMVQKGYRRVKSRKRYGRVMVFTVGGKKIFTTKRKGFTIPAKNFIQKGVDQWLPEVKARWGKKGGSKRLLQDG